ncbi:MAG TPA: hypothetical protein VHO24_13170 [Opitutaceae bacterium]|nr:hypothetical protein [Opitutaceae bacterium]
MQPKRLFASLMFAAVLSVLLLSAALHHHGPHVEPSAAGYAAAAAEHRATVALKTSDGRENASPVSNRLLSRGTMLR